MATYDLSGAGVIALTPGVTRLFVEVLIYGGRAEAGAAIPTNYYHLGLLRVGVQGAYAPVRPIDATEIFIDLPDGATNLGYSLFDTTTIRVSEAPIVIITDPFVTANHIGGADHITDGDSLTVTWGNLEGIATSTDWITLIRAPDAVNDTNGVFSPDLWVYTNSLTQIADTTISTSGTWTSAVQLGAHDPGGFVLLILAHDTNGVLVQGPDYVWIDPAVL